MEKLTPEQQELMRKNLPLARWLAKRYSPNRSLEYDDFASIAFLGMCKGVRTYDSEKGTFATHAVYCARSAVASALRAENRHSCCVSIDSNVSPDEDYSLADLLSSDDPGPDAHAEANETRRALVAAWRTLRTREQEIVVAYFGRGLTLEEVRVYLALDITRERVRQILDGALKKMMHQLRHQRMPDRTDN